MTGSVATAASAASAKTTNQGAFVMVNACCVSGDGGVRVNNEISILFENEKEDFCGLLCCCGRTKKNAKIWRAYKDSLIESNATIQNIQIIVDLAFSYAVPDIELTKKRLRPINDEDMRAITHQVEIFKRMQQEIQTTRWTRLGNWITDSIQSVFYRKTPDPSIMAVFRDHRGKETHSVTIKGGDFKYPATYQEVLQATKEELQRKKITYTQIELNQIMTIVITRQEFHKLLNEDQVRNIEDYQKLSQMKREHLLQMMDKM